MRTQKVLPKLILSSFNPNQKKHREMMIHWGSLLEYPLEFQHEEIDYLPHIPLNIRLVIGAIPESLLPGFGGAFLELLVDVP